MSGIAITTLRIWNQANMLVKSDWLVFSKKLRHIMQNLRHLKAYRVYKF